MIGNLECGLIVNTQSAVTYLVNGAPISEKDARKIVPDIEAYCASHTISMHEFCFRVKTMLRNGVKPRKAMAAVKKACKCE